MITSPTKEMLVNARKVLAAASVAAVAVALAGVVANAATDPPSPASGHASVIAQGLVNFADDSYQWRLDSHMVEAAGNEFAAQTGTFLVAGTSGAVHVDGIEGSWSRLADGEATFRPSGSTAATHTGNGQPATLSTIGIWPADTDGASDAFAPGAGTHDVDLLRDVLATDETFTLQSEIPAFVLVTAGSVDDGTGVPIPAGATANLVGDITLTNTDSSPAVVVVAVIGPVLDLVAIEPPPTTSATGPSPTEAPTAPTTPTTPPAPIDSDGDGLTDGEEADIGSDPNSPDTDVDGLLDGDEVNDYGTNPNAFDTDGDERGDYEEVNDSTGLSATNPDTDGDGLSDSEEPSMYGTDPTLADGDADGFDDGEEVAQGTNPADPLDFPGAPSDDI